jgi:MFS family permease
VRDRSERLGGRPAILGVVVACAAQFFIGVDGLAIAIALPSLQSDLGVAPIDAQSVLTACALAFGGSVLLGGRLGDLYGRRRLLVWGMALFACGAVLAGLAPGLGWLVAARAVQGLGVGGGVGVAIYATVLSAAASSATDPDGYRAAFLAGTVLAVLGVGVALSSRARRRSPRTPGTAARADSTGSR